MSELHDTGALAALERQIDEWLSALAVANPAVAAVGRDPDTPRRWFVRMRGEAKEITTVWLTLGQRTLRYETYVMPAPEENHAQLYEQLLRRNERLVGAHFSIGVEDAVFLRGELALAALRRAVLPLRHPGRFRLALLSHRAAVERPRFRFRAPQALPPCRSVGGVPHRGSRGRRSRAVIGPVGGRA